MQNDYKKLKRLYKAYMQISNKLNILQFKLIYFNFHLFISLAPLFFVLKCKQALDFANSYNYGLRR